MGENKGWKQKSNMGKIGNQRFVSIPFDKFKTKLFSKCKQHGIQYHTIQESYTSKCSALDNEEIKKHSQYLGKRVKRGLFKTSTGKEIHADVNAAMNIFRKFIKKSEKEMPIQISYKMPYYATII